MFCLILVDRNFLPCKTCGQLEVGVSYRERTAEAMAKVAEVLRKLKDLESERSKYSFVLRGSTTICRIFFTVDELFLFFLLYVSSLISLWPSGLL